MRIARYSYQGRRGVGIVTGDEIMPAGDQLLDPAVEGEPISLSAVELLSPIGPGAKIICVGLNYTDHAEESGDTAPEEPLIFAKLPNSLIGSSDPIILPDLSDKVDYEAELGVVIGLRARNVARDEARKVVFGYTCVNDVSARDLQLGDRQWTRGKSLDTFCPVGPWVVTADEIGDPHGLGIRTWVGGELLQDGNTKEMIFDVWHQIETLSTVCTLEPGDVIATGTPAGVGVARTPPRFLRAGDVVRIEIEGIGALENPVLAEPDDTATSLDEPAS